MALAAPTFTEWLAQWSRDIKYFETVYQAGVTVTDDLVGQEDSIIQNLEGASLGVVNHLNALRGVRGSINGAIGENGRALHEARILSVRPIINSTAEDVQETLTDLNEYLVAQNQMLKSRAFTRGSWTADGSNTGDGEIIRCTVDADGNPIENSHAEVITATVVANAGGDKDGSRGKTEPGSEIFQFKGYTLGDDALELEDSNRGSGGDEDIACKRSGDSLILNPSLSDYTGTGASITDISNWTVTNDIANFEQDTTNYFVEDESENGTPAALVITATDTIEQKLSVSGNSFEGDGPYLCQLKFNRTVNSATGTLELHMGTQSKSVTVSAQSGWTTLRLTVGQNSWFKNFDNDEDTSIKIVWTQTGGTGILVDDLRVVKFDEFGNVPTLALGGAARWRVGDTGTITDTQTGAVRQRWVWRHFDRYLKSAADATQVTAAGGRTLTFNDNGGSPDTITASSGDFTTDGYEVGMTLTVAGTSSNNGSYTITAIAATTISVATGSFAAEGPLSATATLDATASITDPSVTF